MDIASQNIFKNLTQSGVSFPQKMKALYSYVVDRINELGIEPHSTIRFRGDVLEVFFVNEDHLPNEFNREFDAYYSAGLMISLMRSVIHSCGYKTTLRTFPRFDEPDLIAFIYISKDKHTVPWFFESSSPSDDDCRCHMKLKRLLHDISNRRMLIADILSDDNIKTMFNGEAKKFRTNDSELILVSSSHNMPSTWLQTGFFAGDLIFNAKKAGYVIEHVDLNDKENNLTRLQVIVSHSSKGVHAQVLFKAIPIVNS